MLEGLRTLLKRADRDPHAVLDIAALSQPIEIDSLSNLEIELRRALAPLSNIDLKFSYGFNRSKEMSELDLVLTEKGAAAASPQICVYFGQHLRATENAINYQGQEVSPGANVALTQAQEKLQQFIDQNPQLSETAIERSAAGVVYRVSSRELLPIFNRYKDAWVVVTGKLLDDQYEGRLTSVKLLSRSLILNFDPNNSVASGGLLIVPEAVKEAIIVCEQPDTFVLAKDRTPTAIPGAPKIHTQLNTIHFLER